jgi:hypothetical protein
VDKTPSVFHALVILEHFATLGCRREIDSRRGEMVVVEKIKQEAKREGGGAVLPESYLGFVF